MIIPSFGVLKPDRNAALLGGHNHIKFSLLNTARCEIEPSFYSACASPLQAVCDHLVCNTKGSSAFEIPSDRQSKAKTLSALYDALDELISVRIDCYFAELVILPDLQFKYRAAAKSYVLRLQLVTHTTIEEPLS